MNKLKPGEDGYGRQQVKESTERRIREHAERVASMRDECERAFGKGTKIYHCSSDGQRVETRQLEVVTK